MPPVDKGSGNRFNNFTTSWTPMLATPLSDSAVFYQSAQMAPGGTSSISGDASQSGCAIILTFNCLITLIFVMDQ